MPKEASPRDEKRESRDRDGKGRESKEIKDREHRESREARESKESKSSKDGKVSSPDTSRRTRKRKSLWDEGAPTQAEKKDAPSTNDPLSLSPGLSPIVVASPLLQKSSSPINNPLILQQQTLIQQQLLQAKNIPQVSTADIANMANSAEILAFACRIYIGSLFYELTEADLLLAFSPFGPISKIDMPKDPSTGRHKGFCFIDYVSPQSAALALSTMNDFVLGGRKIKVGRPNNVPLALQASVAQLGLTNPLSQKTQTHTFPTTQNQNSTIYVGSINYDIVEKDIEAVFSAFGLIKSCQLIPNTETGKHKGYGFIEYVSEESAKAAILSMNGFELGGRQIKVGWASTSPANPAATFSQITQPLMPTLSQPLIQPLVPQVVEKKIDSSRVLLLNNMVTAEEIDDELQNEVTEECGKYGPVEKVVIYQGEAPPNSNESGVKIFVLFTSPQDASSAQKSLDRRWFGGRLVVARFYDEDHFNAEDYSK